VKAGCPAKFQSKQIITPRKAMSAIVKLLAPAELLFQSGDQKENAATKEEAKRLGPSSLCEPEAKFWNLSSKASVPQVVRIELFVLALFLLVAVVGIISCFTELSHLLEGDAIGHVTAKAISGGG
jgi:hypothetical protein